MKEQDGNDEVLFIKYFINVCLSNTNSVGVTGGLSVHEDTRVFVGGPGRRWKGVRTLRRDLLFTEARGDGVMGELSFSQIFSFFSFYLEHRP